MNVSMIFERIRSLFARPERGESIWAHFQNLSRDDGDGELPIRGRAWLHLGEKWAVNVEWNLLSNLFFSGLTIDPSGGEVTLSAAVPPIALWIGIEGKALGRELGDRLGREERQVRIALHDAAVWWRLWANPSEWKSSTPRWRDGSWHPIDDAFGTVKARTVKASGPIDVVVPMPERSYRGQAIVEMIERGRARLPMLSRRSSFVRIEMAEPIPIPGKGENSWDCGDDAIRGISVGASTVSEAIGKLVCDVLVTREKRAGRSWRTAPPAVAPVS